MKTTIEIPDDLFREAKVRAALDGVRLKDVVERGLRLALSRQPGSGPVRVKLPLHKSACPGALKAAAVRKAEDEAILAEDAAYAGTRRR